MGLPQILFEWLTLRTKASGKRAFVKFKTLFIIPPIDVFLNCVEDVVPAMSMVTTPP